MVLKDPVEKKNVYKDSKKDCVFIITSQELP
jgi:hypothetical protein